jgi:hypothetical protein
MTICLIICVRYVIGDETCGCNVEQPVPTQDQGEAIGSESTSNWYCGYFTLSTIFEASPKD